MSYVLTPYLIDLERLRQAVGSQDESLIAALLDEEASDFEDEWEEGEPDEVSDLEISLDHAVRCLVRGEHLGKAAGSQYGYASNGSAGTSVKRSCRTFGAACVGPPWKIQASKTCSRRPAPPCEFPTRAAFPRSGI